jgi:hypothetical protein
MRSERVAIMPKVLVVIPICLLAIFGATAFHYEALRLIRRLARRTRRRMAIPVILIMVMTAHIAEILLYMGLFMLARGPLGLGGFSGDPHGLLGLFYYTVETYSSLGAGDVIPVGEIRLIASAASLNGILLLAWSGAFLFAITEGRLRESGED